MILRIFAGSLIALGLGLFSEGAQANQTFMCDDGRMVQVKFEDLERRKRTDACVAAHFGLTVQLVPLPRQRPKDFSGRGLKGAQAATPERPEIGAVATSTDYRNVRIINAGPGSTGWYQHTR